MSHVIIAGVPYRSYKEAWVKLGQGGVKYMTFLKRQREGHPILDCFLSPEKFEAKMRERNREKKQREIEAKARKRKVPVEDWVKIERAEKRKKPQTYWSWEG